MRFVFDLTIPKNTLATAPAELKVQLVRGRLIGVKIRFRQGCHFQVRTVIRDALFQVVPAVEGTSLYGNGEIFDVPASYDLSDVSHELICQGWSPDTKYQHVLTYFFDIQPTGGDTDLDLLQLLFAAPDVKVTL